MHTRLVKIGTSENSLQGVFSGNRFQYWSSEGLITKSELQDEKFFELSGVRFNFIQSCDSAALALKVQMVHKKSGE